MNSPIKPDLIIKTIDGPTYAPNHKRIVRVQKPAPIKGFWICTDFINGELLTIHEDKLIQSLKEQNNGQPPP